MKKYMYSMCAMIVLMPQGLFGGLRSLNSSLPVSRPSCIDTGKIVPAPCDPKPDKKNNLNDIVDGGPIRRQRLALVKAFIDANVLLRIAFSYDYKWFYIQGFKTQEGYELFAEGGFIAANCSDQLLWSYLKGHCLPACQDEAERAALEQQLDAFHESIGRPPFQHWLA